MYSSPCQLPRPRRYPMREGLHPLKRTPATIFTGVLFVPFFFAKLQIHSCRFCLSPVHKFLTQRFSNSGLKPAPFLLYNCQPFPTASRLWPYPLYRFLPFKTLLKRQSADILPAAQKSLRWRAEAFLRKSRLDSF